MEHFDFHCDHVCVECGVQDKHMLTQDHIVGVCSGGLRKVVQANCVRQIFIWRNHYFNACVGFATCDKI